MKIINYAYRDIDSTGWNFTPIKFDGLNLLVGNSASGKSRFLNTIFNLGVFVVRKEFKNGTWDITFEHSGVTYSWQLQTEKEDEDGRIVRDNIWKYEGENKTLIVERDAKKFKFLDKELPKLSLKETSISLLKDEEVIKPIYEAFSLIMRRLFFLDALRKVSEVQSIPTKIIKDIEKHRNINKLYQSELNLSSNLYILQKYFKKTYKEIMQEYKKIFPFIGDTRITNATLNTKLVVDGNVPVFSIKEKNSDKWVPIHDMSSGMQKVLLILTDIFMLPDNSVYIIDEYENSLGLNAINFFPEFILTLEKKIQFFITSHHPYIINNIPLNNWYIFHRENMQVFIKYGEEVVQRFGASKQQAFIQLINDPFFSKGVVVE